MIKMKFEIIPTKGILYDKCENVEQLYDNYYYPLLVEFKELQKQNANLKEHYNNMFECHCNRIEVEKLQNNWNELKKWVEKQSKFIKDIPVFTSDIANNHAGMIGAYDTTLEKMQELEGNNENNTSI